MWIQWRWYLVTKSQVKSLACPCGRNKAENTNFDFEFFRLNSGTAELANLFTNDLVTRDHPPLNPHSPCPTVAGGHEIIESSLLYGSD